MTARDDYPELAALGNAGPAAFYAEIEARKALDEIDRLRADLTALYTELGIDP